ncbi:MAG: hypothetical protein KKG59_00890, partial [Nanoarchaeota archaeon]|nr:hypothetical protein [Nanoarchaeota archaeon]
MGFMWIKSRTERRQEKINPHIAEVRNYRDFHFDLGSLYNLRNWLDFIFMKIRPKLRQEGLLSDPKMQPLIKKGLGDLMADRYSHLLELLDVYEEIDVNPFFQTLFNLHRHYMHFPEDYRRRYPQIQKEFDYVQLQVELWHEANATLKQLRETITALKNQARAHEIVVDSGPQEHMPFMESLVKFCGDYKSENWKPLQTHTVNDYLRVSFEFYEKVIPWRYSAKVKQSAKSDMPKEEEQRLSEELAKIGQQTYHDVNQLIQQVFTEAKGIVGFTERTMQAYREMEKAMQTRVQHTSSALEHYNNIRRIVDGYNREDPALIWQGAMALEENKGFGSAIISVSNNKFRGYRKILVNHGQAASALGENQRWDDKNERLLVSASDYVARIRRIIQMGLKPSGSDDSHFDNPELKQLQEIWVYEYDPHKISPYGYINIVFDPGEHTVFKSAKNYDNIGRQHEMFILAKKVKRDFRILLLTSKGNPKHRISVGGKYMSSAQYIKEIKAELKK